MKYFTLITLFFLGLHISLSAQCLPGGITLTSQAQVDAFASNYPGCTEILGDLNIGSSNVSDITNLNGLSQIEKVGGKLVIFNVANLSNLNGLYNLSTVGGRMAIDSDGSLSDVSALYSLKTIGGNFDIVDCDMLTNLNGMYSLFTIGGNLEIGNNNALSDLTAFQYVSSIYGLNIYNNAALTNLDGFQNIQTLAGGIRLFNNQALTSLEGLNSLESVGTNLTLDSNSNLENLDALESLGSIGDALAIYSSTSLTSLKGLKKLKAAHIVLENNPAITSLNGLQNLTDNRNSPVTIFNNDALTSLIGIANIDPATIVNLDISGNASLSICNVPSICGYLSNAGAPATINGNTSGSNSRAEVESACATTGCPNADFILTSQADVNLFPNLYTNCANPTGNLTIGTSQVGDIRDLTPLYQIKSVAGKLTLFSNDGLKSLEGLGGIKEVGGDLFIDTNRSLESLTGLEELETVGGILYIISCDSLILPINTESFTPWKLTSTGGLSLQNNHMMVGLYGFRYLTNLNGGPLDITNNDELQIITSLRDIDPATIGNLTIQDNAVLSWCNVKSICQYLDTPGNAATITNNAAGCNDRAQVEAACEVTFGSQIGQEIRGDEVYSRFGDNLALSADASRLAVSAYWANDYKGMARVYEWSNNTWTAMGPDIKGTDEYGALGADLDLSNDGSRLLVGNFQTSYNEGPGSVQAYTWQNGAWTPEGDVLLSQNQPDGNVFFGYGNSISGNGARIGIVDETLNNGPGLMPEARIYEWQNGNWAQLGNTIVGETQNDQFNMTALSENGSRVAIANPRNNLVNGGKVQVYDYNAGTNTWIQAGTDITRGVESDYFGSVIAMSDNGNRIVIIDTEENVYVYEWQNGDWSQMGDILSGDFITNEFDISGDGSRIAFGAPSYDEGDFESLGAATVYEWNGSTWMQIGDTIKGQDLDEDLGSGISLSANGKFIAAGAPSSTLDEKGTGFVRVYGLPMSSAASTIGGIEVEVYPNPTTDIVNIKGITPDYILVTDVQGQLVKMQKNATSKVDLSSLTPGIYFLEIRSGGQWGVQQVIKM